ncbi:DNA cytosine methyltransferase [Xylocopilactobacillus apicola]|uniref:Cytosine-specific methyltransferase n=1 Tax=Xylocopilactobacillus apicola TaxID=2932184 RepID=A0AAU9DW22_9LACO|nr:DNA cytosine methyltransferase [Xylocopilactobacillus apicola]BDR59678.1 restriction endonuclease subunit M [Xylocopilactobacillus apicola]
MEINAVDLFCGLGGLTYGLSSAGINVVAGIDIEKKCSFPYSKNNHAAFIPGDLKEISPDFIDLLYPPDTDIKVLVGCAPCQPFSSYSYRYKGSDQTKNKMDLLHYFGKIVEEIHPDIVSMENVPQLAKEGVFAEFLEVLKNAGYQVDWQIVYAPKYGVPQKRKRLILLASKFGSISLIPPIYQEQNYPTVRMAIGDLPPIQSGARSKIDPMHRSVQLTEINLKRIRQSKPGGTWKDWDQTLLPKAYTKKSGQSYTSIYGRMKWDEPAPTITTKFYGYGNGRFGHPDQDRAISYREGALLQTFPRNYQFFDEEHQLSTKELGIMIGNAVPVKLGEATGKNIIKHIEKRGHDHIS